MHITITEALAKIKTLEKRIAKKHEFVARYSWRPRAIVDPHPNSGGSAKLLQEERQAIKDLLAEWVRLRMAINKANSDNTIVIGGVEKSIAEWLIWRREVAPVLKRTIDELNAHINQARQAAQKKNVPLKQWDTPAEPDGGYQDVLVNLNEKDLADESEALVATLGELDGLFSLKNATITVEV